MKKVSKDQPIAIPADTYNQFIDMAKGRNTLSRFKNKNIATNTIDIINKTGDKLPMFGIVLIDADFGINQPFKVDIDKVADFDRKRTLDGILTYHNFSSTNVYSIEKRLAVVQVPCEKEGIVNAIYKGLAKVKLKKEKNLDESGDLYVTSDDGKVTHLNVTNMPSCDKLIWHNFDFTLGIVQLGALPREEIPFIGILDCVPEVNPPPSFGTYKIVVKEYGNGKEYEIKMAVNPLYPYSFRYIVKRPPRPRSTCVYGFRDTPTTAFIQPLYSFDYSGVVKYDDAETTLNSTILGRRSSVDRIADIYGKDTSVFPYDGRKQLINLWGQSE